MRKTFLLAIFTVSGCSNWGKFWEQDTITASSGVVGKGTITTAAGSYSALANQSVSVAALFSTSYPPFTYTLIAGGGAINAATGIYSPGAYTGSTIIRATDAQGATATVTLTVTSYSAMILAETGLTYYFRMDEPSANISDIKSATTGTATGTGFSYSQPGAIVGDAGTAIGLTGGTGRFVTSGTNTMNATSFSVECWVKRSAIGNPHTMVSHGTNLTNQGLQLGFNGTGFNYLRFGFYAADLDSPSASETDTTTFHHYAFTYNLGSTRRTMYKDGVEIATTTTGTYNYATNGAWTIGSSNWGAGTDPMNGVLDEVAIYVGTVLTPAQVLKHYNAGKGILFQ